ncbi:MAG: metal-binding transmembrane [Methylocystaceae bacterium]|nr:MAG: metal-binding transmembrane [Methylocystaceae bacterium]
MVELTDGAAGMEPMRVDLIALQRNAILALLIALSVAAWALLIWQGAGHDAHSSMASPSMGLGAPLFIAVWLAMTIAMMFPTVAPMALTFHKTQAARRKRGQAFVGTWAFLAGYLLPAHAVERTLPDQMPHADQLHHDLLARGDARRLADGRAPRRLVPWLLLDALRDHVSARHDERRRPCESSLRRFRSSMDDGDFAGPRSYGTSREGPELARRGHSVLARPRRLLPS